MASIFDAFSAPNTAGPQIAGINQGYSLALPAIQQGSSDLTGYYTSALQPFMQNYNTATQGTTALGNALGLNGPQGNQAATQSFWNNPAISTAINAGSQNVQRNAAATGQLTSGATLKALQDQAQTTASGGWNNYVSALQPYLGASNAAASGIAGVNTGLGSALNQNQNNIGQLGWAYGTGIGNAQANQNIENVQAAAAPWNLLLGLGGMKTNAAGGTVGGNLLTGLGSGLSSAGSSLLGILSDERLKEDIKPVGELYDGTNIYLYNYIGDPTPRLGLMAQEVERTRPDAVIEIGPHRIKAVDYGRATQLAAALSRFNDTDGDVVAFPKARETNYSSVLSRFLEAA
jgi:hypothetical protein